MAYIKTDWQDGDVITEAGLDHLETGVYNNSVAIGDLSELDTTAKANLVAAINEAAQSGGGGGSSVLIVHFSAEEEEDPIESDKTFAEISAAIEAGKLVVMEFGGLTYQLCGYEANSYAAFANVGASNNNRLVEFVYEISSTDEITSTYTETDSVPTQAAVSNGSIVFKNSNSATLFSVALPIYNGGVS